jgi:hypothetical protein
MPKITVTLFSVVVLLVFAGCGDDTGQDAPSRDYGQFLSLEEGGNRVHVPITGRTDGASPGEFSLALRRDVRLPVSPEVIQSGDSLTLSRHFPLGGGSVLILTGTSPDPGRLSAVKSMLEGSILERWPGLRSVTLSDTSPASIDSARNRIPRDAPLIIHHNVDIRFAPTHSESSLTVVDTLSFSGRYSPFLSVNRDMAGTLEAVVGSIEYEAHRGWRCVADSSLFPPEFVGVYREVIPRNWYTTDASTGEILGRSRLNSSLLGGRYLPVGDYPNRFDIQVTAPRGMQVFVPLSPSYSLNDTLQAFTTGTGLVRGTVPVFIGDYEELLLSDGRSRLLIQADIDDESMEQGLHWADNLGGFLQQHLGFPGSTFSILVLEDDGNGFSVPYHGCLVVSPGALESVSGVFSWADSLSVGRPGRGIGVVASAAASFTLQSIYIDPVLADMIQAWIPCRFMAVYGTQDGLIGMRRAYRKYYLHQTEATGGLEHALSDPDLRGSPLYDPVVRGKGPVVLEYLEREGCLRSLPNLLDNLRHSGSYWPKLHTNLGFFEGQSRYRLIRDFLYTPGIPQVEVEWWIEGGVLQAFTRQMQPSDSFSIQFRSAVLLFENNDPITIMLSQDSSGRLSGIIPSRASDPVVGIDVNPEEVIPADIVYRRRARGSE